MSAKKTNNKTGNPSSSNKAFLAVLVLFSAFSMYVIVSFYSSTDKYIDNMQASVVGSDVSFEDLGLPLECETCPPNTAVCDPYCVQTDAVEQEPIENIFNDVTSADASAEAIKELYYDGVISGYEDGTFKPGNFVNRAEVWTMLTNAIDADLSGNFSNCFTDVSTEWFAPFVCYAKNQGWIAGYPDGSYGPANTVIRAEALKMIMEAFGFEIPQTALTENPAPDVAITDWFAMYVRVAKDKGILPSLGNFEPSKQMDRAAFAQMIYDSLNSL